MKELQKIKFENYEELWNCITDTKVLDANGVLVDILVFENDNADEIGNAFIYTNKDLEIIMEDFENCSKLLNSQSEMTIHKEWDEIVDFIPHIRHYKDLCDLLKIIKTKELYFLHGVLLKKFKQYKRALQSLEKAKDLGYEIKELDKLLKECNALKDI